MNPPVAAADELAVEGHRCVVCDDWIGEQETLRHPSRRICIDCLSPEERQALQDDVNAAARVQNALLPPPRVRHGAWDFAMHWEPYGVVSGDHVDLQLPRVEGEALHLLFGDIAGKGLAASLLQAHLHALFRALAPSGMPLAQMLERANRLFFEATAAQSFATLIALRLHADGRIELANAGHPRPLLADARGVRPVEEASIPLGVVADARYQERTLQLAAGDMLYLFSDGLTEAHHGGEEYGDARAAAALRRARRGKSDLRGLLADCRADLAGFLGEARGHDDLSLVGVRFGG